MQDGARHGAINRGMFNRCLKSSEATSSHPLEWLLSKVTSSEGKLELLGVANGNIKCHSQCAKLVSGSSKR